MDAPVGAVINLSSVVQVYFVTDRDRLPASGIIQTFGKLRSDSFSYGSVQVSIPATHQTGFIEAPSSLVHIRFLEDPLKHILLLKSTVLTKESFLQQIQNRVGESEKKEAFLFVHGFNTTFEQAALRSAQMSFDLGFRGAPIFYSWPSKGSPTPLGYVADSQTVDWAKGNLKIFLEEFLLKTNADRVYLIAHSMGTQALTDTVTTLLSARPELRSKVKEVILAAPDIDAGIFRRDIAPAMVRIGSPVTIYASSKDVALQLSHLASDYPRVGDSGSGLVLIDGIETIDASNVSLGFLGHSVFAESRDVLSDWRYIIEQGLRARERAGLMQVNMPRPYWTFRK
ncbi:alpha/beta fold hydrolase [Janthinobacterium sp. SUN211]|uniref:alpha/beta hydrolase n=1 Tax=Janthinobacterium sp. SUN211 TaxID=3014786 RepID=UPI002712FF18|nr:alpha/beta fold hydrolase [Janthinobacterium sp. SUN211]MDO8051113.1 alpha/beta fold hydrolase [Janthinobacterium sp. SUN211]